MIKLRFNNEKLFYLFFLVLALNFSFLKDIKAQNGKKIKTVVIDAGHGGKDSGAVGKKSLEKDITLKVALMTGDYIKQYCPDVEVIYTRSSDKAVSLYQRAKIANDRNADIFISIHCNSTTSTSPYGVETFVMGEHKNAANLEVAKLENAAILHEDEAEQDYGGFDPNSTEAYIMLNFFQSEYKNASLDLAERIQNQLVKRVGRKDRGVQQAGFLVLYRTMMPSVLVEIGFLSNPNEEKFLLSKEGQTYIASAIFRAFRDYKVAYEKDNAIVENNDTEDVNTNNNKIIYKVQIESRSRKISNPKEHYSTLSEIDYYEHNGLYKYTSGSFDNKKDAEKHCKSVKEKGYESAFVVQFKNGKRID